MIGSERNVVSRRKPHVEVRRSPTRHAPTPDSQGTPLDTACVGRRPSLGGSNMKMRRLQLAAALLGASPLLAAGQQPARPMPMQNQSAMTCPMGMHGMIMGPMGDSMMRG